MNNKQTGKYGETLAVIWLINNQYTVIDANWRCGRYEIDVVALKEKVWHCVEVKTTTGAGFGWPEENIKTRKLFNMRQAAELYVQTKEVQDELQIDVLAIQIRKRNIEYLFIENI